ncbi:hypothetical protein BSR28_08040 [Boudabousia liubingyangii]|uniref:vitamin K epoxide reductase family protein n=1 Tax=Boudabousia liubingyangii TaxID=1921764 RepID=UPI00093E555C|nr:vitamin K epoxide reductase family protein [Boudabousia liubingyangii]OKL46461.1 hypothetical protein BSR28_08040 [Boudabousia liubingyangii]
MSEQNRPTGPTPDTEDWQASTLPQDAANVDPNRANPVEAEANASSQPQEVAENLKAGSAESPESETEITGPADEASEESESKKLSDAELYAELKARNQPSEHEAAGGLDFLPSLSLLLLSLIGLVSSVALTVATIGHAKDPLAKQSCDINSWISCGASMSSWKSEILGIPNALVGVMAFAALSTVAVLLLSKVQIARWFWIAMSFAAVVALLFVYWFAWESAFTFRALCPWCMVTWVVMIAIFTILVGRAARAQIPGLGWLGRPMVREWWAFMAIMYALIVIIIVAGLGTRLFS